MRSCPEMTKIYPYIYIVQKPNNSGVKNNKRQFSTLVKGCWINWWRLIHSKCADPGAQGSPSILAASLQGRKCFPYSQMGNLGLWELRPLVSAPGGVWAGVSGLKAPSFACRLSQTLKRSHCFPLWFFRFGLYKNNLDFCFLNFYSREKSVETMSRYWTGAIRKERCLGNLVIMPKKFRRLGGW